MEVKLEKITRELLEQDVTWALGGSCLLSYYGLINTVNDIDILIGEHGQEVVDTTLSHIANRKEAISKDPFSTRHFMVYDIDGTSIDVMGGFQISHNNGTYKLAFDRSSITNYMQLGDINVPLSSLEDWYILYSLIPGKQYKADLIEAHWKKNGIENLHLLNRSMKKNLPVNLYTKVNQILKLKGKESQ